MLQGVCVCVNLVGQAADSLRERHLRTIAYKYACVSLSVLYLSLNERGNIIQETRSQSMLH